MPTPFSKPSNRAPLSKLMLEARARESETGETLLELERRQDDVLSQLDDLDQKLSSILRGLGVSFVENADDDSPSIRLADLGDDIDENESSNGSKETELVSDEAETQSVSHSRGGTRRKAA